MERKPLILAIALLGLSCLQVTTAEDDDKEENERGEVDLAILSLLSSHYS
jgi:hypothetical protein